MAMIGLTSAHGSPGTTSLAVALAHRLGQHTGRATLLLEADADGGTLAARHGLAGPPGLTALAGAARSGIRSEDIERFTTTMPSGVAVIAGHPSAEQTHVALRVAAAHLAPVLAELPGCDVLVDLGRLRPGSHAQPLAAACERLIVVVRPVLEQLVAVADRLAAYEQLAPVQLVLVGTRPYPIAEVRRALRIDDVAVIADDDRAVVADPAAARRRGAWQRSVDDLAAALARPMVEPDGLAVAG